jgi:hypothetical protein
MGAKPAMGEYAGADGLNSKSSSVAERRANLVVECARELLGPQAPHEGDLHLPLSVTEFERELRDRFGTTHPELVFRTDSTVERARLERRGLRHIPKVVLRQGAPRRELKRA